MGSVTQGGVTVSGGLFTVELDFGAVFDGTALWLDIGVRSGSSSGAYTALTPRQPLTPTPYAHILRPGADIAGSVGGGILNIRNDSVSAGDGLHIVSTTGDGVQISSAGWDGVYVAWPRSWGVTISTYPSS